jgi:hypothetical protein
VSVRVYDLLGRAVSVLTDGEAMRSGTHEVSFEARSLPSGVYTYRVETAGGLAFGSMTLVRAE